MQLPVQVERISGDPVVEVLLRCARTRLREADEVVLRALLADQAFDWSKLLHTARRFHQLPLLLKNLTVIGVEVVPPAELRQLREFDAESRARNENSAAELLRLMDLCASAKFDMVAFKGPVIAVMAYGDLHQRCYYDLDVLVRHDDVARAKAFFFDNGYEPLPDYQFKWEWHFVNKAAEVYVDLHDSITLPELPSPRDFEAFWQRLEPVTLSGRQILSFGLLDSLSILCMQACKDWHEKNNFLTKICDIHELLQRHPEIDWQAFLSRSRDQGIYRTVLLALRLTERFLGFSLPPPLRAAFEAETMIRALHIDVEERLLVPPRRPLDQFVQIRSQMSLHEDIAKRLWRPFAVYIVRKLFTPTEEDAKALPLPPWLDFLYYLLRPLRLAGKACASTLRANRAR